MANNLDYSMDRWSIYIDIEGFSAAYEANSKAQLLLNALMEGIYRIGTKCFPDPPNRIFAHQLGDGFVIVGEFGVRTLEVPLSIAILLMRLVLKARGVAAAAISEGSFADIRGCYPSCIKENADKHGVIRLGRGLMSIFPMMGTALITSYRVLRLSPSGSLLVLENTLASRLPEELQFIDIFDSDLLSVDWLHSHLPLVIDLVNRAGLVLPDKRKMESLLKQYLESNELPSEWRRNTLKALHLI